MKILQTDETLYIFPSGHYYTDSVFDGSGEFIYWLSNMFDSYPLNYTQLYNGCTNIIEVRTENSSMIGVSGGNLNTVQVDVVNGVPHDSSDLISNGDFLSWDSALTAPDDWTVEADCTITQGSTSLSVGGITYTDYVDMGVPGSSNDNAMYQTISVLENTKYKLSILYGKENTGDAEYYIEDLINSDIFIREDITFPNPQLTNPTDTIGWLHDLFTTPDGCTSINIGIRTLDTVDNQLSIYAVSLHQVSESFSEVDITDQRLYSGTQFNSYVKEYTEILGEHSVMLTIIGVTNNLRIGEIRTGILTEFNDPLVGMNQGLYFNSVKSDLKFGGRLIDAKYNQDVFNCSVNLLHADAYTFMYVVVPTLKSTPTFFILGELSGQQWSFFAKFSDELPNQKRNDHISSTITFNLKEVI